VGLLKRIQLRGFKSIKSMDLELRALNVMIGANGSGKSNLISYFKLLHAMVTRNIGLDVFVTESGNSQSLLHHGSKITPRIDGELVYENDHGEYLYTQSLLAAPRDRLAFGEENIDLVAVNTGQRVNLRLAMGEGYLVSRLDDWAYQGDPGAFAFGPLFRQSRPFHFNDTSSTSPIRQSVYAEDNQKLSADGRNLAAVLAWLKTGEDKRPYQRIISTIKLIAPYFGDFEFADGGRQRLLDWHEKGSDILFGPHQISDGTLRAMCLITLLMLPHDQLPSIIIVDEPELGLHPYAIEIVASLFKSAAERTQVLVSTQSTAFLNHFEPEDIVVVDRVGKESRFSRPDAGKLREWLEDYTLGEVWEKNVIGGGPH